MAEKTVTLKNKDALTEVLRREKDPEVKRKLSFALVVAIEEGATMMRIGRAIFGERR